MGRVWPTGHCSLTPAAHKAVSLRQSGRRKSRRPRGREGAKRVGTDRNVRFGLRRSSTMTSESVLCPGGAFSDKSLYRPLSGAQATQLHHPPPQASPPKMRALTTISPMFSKSQFLRCLEVEYFHTDYLVKSVVNFIFRTTNVSFFHIILFPKIHITKIFLMM